MSWSFVLWPDYEIAGERVPGLSARVRPFSVRNAASKSALKCVLVAFFKNETFVFAVYVNVNNGKTSLDFLDAAGLKLLESESRYPYLTRMECDKQDKVYFTQFFDTSELKKRQKVLDDARSVAREFATNDVEVLIKDL